VKQTYSLRHFISCAVASNAFSTATVTVRDVAVLQTEQEFLSHHHLVLRYFVYRHSSTCAGVTFGRSSASLNCVCVCVYIWSRRSGDQIPVDARFSAPAQTGPGTHPDFYTTGIRSFMGVKRPGRGVEHPPPSSAEVNP
jgi:hypothetical protein